jgi:hypothetical protein
MGIDLLREHLRTLAVQPRRKRLTRNVTPHHCIVAHGRSARKGLAKADGGNQTRRPGDGVQRRMRRRHTGLLQHGLRLADIAT